MRRFPSRSNSRKCLWSWSAHNWTTYLNLSYLITNCVADSNTMDLSTTTNSEAPGEEDHGRYGTSVYLKFQQKTQGGDEGQTLYCCRRGCNTNTLWTFHELWASWERHTWIFLLLSSHMMFWLAVFGGTKRRIFPLDILPHTMVDANGLYGATLSLPFMVLS